MAEIFGGEQGDREISSFDNAFNRNRLREIAELEQQPVPLDHGFDFLRRVVTRNCRSLAMMCHRSWTKHHSIAPFSGAPAPFHIFPVERFVDGASRKERSSLVWNRRGAAACVEAFHRHVGSRDQVVNGREAVSRTRWSNSFHPGNATCPSGRSAKQPRNTWHAGGGWVPESAWLKRRVAVQQVYPVEFDGPQTSVDRAGEPQRTVHGHGSRDTRPPANRRFNAGDPFTTTITSTGSLQRATAPYDAARRTVPRHCRAPESRMERPGSSRAGPSGSTLASPAFAPDHLRPCRSPGTPSSTTGGAMPSDAPPIEDPGTRSSQAIRARIRGPVGRIPPPAHLRTIHVPGSELNGPKLRPAVLDWKMRSNRIVFSGDSRFLQSPCRYNRQPGDWDRLSAREATCRRPAEHAIRPEARARPWLAGCSRCGPRPMDRANREPVARCALGSR